MTTTRSKIDIAVDLLQQHAMFSRKEMIALFQTKLNMTEAGATTYYYNAKKKSTAGSLKTAKESPNRERSSNVTEKSTWDPHGEILDRSLTDTPVSFTRESARWELGVIVDC